MSKSGLRHIDVGPELARTEWESEESHELIHGTSFPSSPTERQLFYRDDEHKWYIYNGTDWVSLQGGGGIEVHGNEYHDPDFATEAALAAHETATSGVHGAEGNTLWHGGLTNIIDKSHLSQDFGASSLRLLAWNFTPKQGKAFQVSNTGAASPFSGLINGNPTSTSVVYDGETNETCLKGLTSGADRWGRFILHNNTRGNSRLVVSWDVDINTITTESSTDNWADNDVITLQSTTCTQAGYMDLDLSDELDSDEVYAYFQAEVLEKAGAAGQRMILHPFASYNQGKRIMCPAYLANEFTVVTAVMSIISQKICVYWGAFTEAAPALSVLGTLEYADT